jgi:hypothetical protein
MKMRLNNNVFIKKIGKEISYIIGLASLRMISREENKNKSQR